ncbi:MAG: hypothetical protein ABR564_02440 [Candidatus Dormibacteria bacterium]
MASLSILLLAICAAGLLIAGYLAVYDYSTPSAEAPLLTALAAVFGTVVALNVVAAAVRHLGRR